MCHTTKIVLTVSQLGCFILSRSCFRTCVSPCARVLAWSYLCQSCFIPPQRPLPSPRLERALSTQFSLEHHLQAISLISKGSPIILAANTPDLRRRHVVRGLASQCHARTAKPLVYAIAMNAEATIPRGLGQGTHEHLGILMLCTLPLIPGPRINR